MQSQKWMQTARLLTALLPGLLLGHLADTTPFTFRDGYIHRPTAPGPGITIDEDAVRAAAERGHRWRTPVLRNADGSLAPW